MQVASEQVHLSAVHGVAEPFLKGRLGCEAHALGWLVGWAHAVDAVVARGVVRVVGLDDPLAPVDAESAGVDETGEMS